MQNERKIKVASVFSGIGAPEFALRRAKIPHMLVFACDNGEIEISEAEDDVRKHLKGLSFLEQKAYIESKLPKRINYVKESYLANYDIDADSFHHDVRFLDGNQYRGQIDLFVGGSPCQSFTLLGYQKGLEEARGTLFYEFARLVQEIQPKSFIYENVQGLLKHDGGKTWEVVQRVFHALGYKLHWQVLDAVNYGIPQKRRRIFVVGFRQGGDAFAFPNGEILKYRMQDFLLDNTPEGNFVSKNGKIFIKHDKGDVPSKYFLSEKIIPGIMSAGTGGFEMKPEINLEIARPLMRTMHKMHRAGEDNYVTTNGKIRRLTPRECLRLMGFTDDFKQVVSDTQMYQQAGNSIVVDVMIALIKEVIKHV